MSDADARLQQTLKEFDREIEQLEGEIVNLNNSLADRRARLAAAEAAKEKIRAILPFAAPAPSVSVSAPATSGRRPGSSTGGK